MGQEPGLRYLGLVPSFRHPKALLLPSLTFHFSNIIYIRYFQCKFVGTWGSHGVSDLYKVEKILHVIWHKLVNFQGETEGNSSMNLTQPRNLKPIEVATIKMDKFKHSIHINGMYTTAFRSQRKHLHFSSSNLQMCSFPLPFQRGVLQTNINIYN